MRLLVTALALLAVSCNQGSVTQPIDQPAPPSAKPRPTTFADSPGPAPRIDSARTWRYLQEIVAIGRRAPGSPGHTKIQAYLRARLRSDEVEADRFTATTPAGKFELTNLIAKFPGTTDDIVVIGSHYETNYPLPQKFVGANDSGSSTALLLELANQLRGRKRSGPAVWLVWFDGEEAFKEWSETDGLYGSRHLAARWKRDGTVKRIRAFILADMIADRDLNIDRDTNSTPWLRDVVAEAAQNLNVSAHFFAREIAVTDDHLPFARAGVPVIDLIDLDYGYNNVFHHSTEDTLDKLSPKSMQIVGDVILESLRLLGA